MRVGEALRICVGRGVPGIPCVDTDGRICGRFSVRDTFRITSIPADMIKRAHLIAVTEAERSGIPGARITPLAWMRLGMPTTLLGLTMASIIYVFLRTVRGLNTKPINWDGRISRQSMA
jgi:hypothetical protein